MDMDLLSQTYYGNTVLGWMTALVIIVGAVVVGKLLYWVFGNVVYYIKKAADILGTQTAMNMAILERFNAAGLEFAFPTQTLYTKPA